MPIGDFERGVLRVIASNRHPESFVAGATVLNQSASSPRASQDVDVFHDTTESLARSVEVDMASLRAAGFTLELGKPQDTFQRVIVRRDGQKTKVEWVFDSAFRFFPVEPDVELGWRLNFWDAATNKALALFGRQEFRDWVDILYLHEHHLHYGALVWAAAGKDPGLTPELIIDWSKRHAIFSPDQVLEIRPVKPLDLVQMKRNWLNLTAEALALIARLPISEVGCFYLDAQGRPVCPDPAAPEFPRLTRHFGSVRGAWPRIAD